MTRDFGFIKYSFCLILSMFFVTLGYAQESSTKDDSIQEVAFSTSWCLDHGKVGTSISHFRNL